MGKSRSEGFYSLAMVAIGLWMGVSISNFTGQVFVFGLASILMVVGMIGFLVSE